MPDIPAPANRALSILRQAGYEANLVGGCVRDLLLGKQPKDWDIATDATPEESAALFSGFKTIQTGLRHGTITVIIERMPLEITTFRKDTLKEDLAHRDFTVNALALDSELGIIDCFGGKNDLAAGIIRCVGSPSQRFAEDGLRVLRALRFASVLKFTVAPETAAAIHAHKSLLQNISSERITAELDKLLCGRNAEEVLREYADVLCVPIPEIEPMFGFEQHNEHHCFDVWRHTVAAVSNTESSAILRWAALFHDIGKIRAFSLDKNGVGHFYGHADLSEHIADTIMQRLKFDNATRENILSLIANHSAPMSNNKRAVKRYLNRFGEAMLRNLLSLHRADNLGQSPAFRYRQKELDAVQATLEEVLKENACFSLRNLAVNGNDLLARGLVGRDIGKALDFLLNAVIDEQVENERGVLLDYINSDSLRFITTDFGSR